MMNTCRSNLGRAERICHCGTPFVNFHLGLCTIYHHLVKIDVHGYSANVKVIKIVKIKKKKTKQKMRCIPCKDSQ